MICMYYDCGDRAIIAYCIDDSIEYNKQLYNNSIKNSKQFNKNYNITIKNSKKFNKKLKKYKRTLKK